MRKSNPKLSSRLGIICTYSFDGFSGKTYALHYAKKARTEVPALNVFTTE